MKIPFFSSKIRYSIAVDCLGLSPWMIENLAPQGVDIIDISQLGLIEAVNQVRQNVRVLILQEADGSRSADLVRALLPELVLEVKPRRSYESPDPFDNYALGLHTTFSQDSLGSPLVGWVSLSVYCPKGKSLSHLEPLYGPTAPPLQSGAPPLWATSPLERTLVFKGKTIERNNPVLTKYLQASMQGTHPLPLQAGLPNELPNEPIVLTSEGNDYKGYIASSPKDPGQFMVLDQVDLASILGYSLSSDLLGSVDLSGLVSKQVASEVLRWINLNVSNE